MGIEMLHGANACGNVLNIDTQRKGTASRALQEAGYNHWSLSDYTEIKEGGRRRERLREETSALMCSPPRQPSGFFMEPAKVLVSEFC